MKIPFFAAAMLSAFALPNRTGAAAVDSVYAFEGGLGVSNYEQDQADYSQRLDAAVSGKTSWPLNYLGFSHAAETETDFYGEAPYSPMDQENTLYAGHQFRLEIPTFANLPGLYIPVTVGASFAQQVYRGDSTGYAGDPGFSTRIHQRKTYYDGGIFVGISPSLLLGETVMLGMNAYADLNGRQLEVGLGVHCGLLLGPFRSHGAR